MFLPSILLVHFLNGYAVPISCSNETSLFGESAVPALTGSAQQQRRTLSSVAWSCILTVIVCAWTSVHPNLPPRSRQQALLRRIKLMFWTVVAPELVLAWAVRQWFAAKEVRDIYNKPKEWRGWTMDHGHFLVMGGYQLANEDFKTCGRPGWIASSQEWDAYQERKRKSQLGVLTLDRFRELVNDPNFEFPRISTAEIQDRSKGDGLSKMIAVLQTSWFIAQCVARTMQGLALTELELVTLAMASLNAITFAFWWSKPLSVQEPVNVYVPAVATEEVRIHQEDIRRVYGVGPRDVIREALHEVRCAMRFILDPLRNREKHKRSYALALYLFRLPYPLFFVISWPLFFLFPFSILVLLWVIKTKPERVENAQGDETVATRVQHHLHMMRYRLTHKVCQYFGRPYGSLSSTVSNPYYEPPFITSWFFVVPASFILFVLALIILSPLFTIFFIASFTFTAVFEIVATNTVRPGATHVPSFYAPRTKNDRYCRMIVFAIFGVIFGGIHCFGWNFIFPTEFEHAIWRYTSVVLTAIPVAVAPIDCILENVKLDSGFRKKVRLALDIFMTTLLFVYVPARLSLIAQALALLRDQPATAYIAVDWTKCIPHLFN